MRPHFILAILATVQAGIFFEDPRSERLKANLESIGYEIIDSSGIVKDSVIETLDPNALKEWLEAHGVYDAAQSVADNAKAHKDLLLKDVQDYAEAGHASAKHLINKGKEYYAAQQQNALDLWSDSRLKEFLDARGVPVPQSSNRDVLLAKVAKIKHNLPLVNPTGPSGRYWFDGWSKDELKAALEKLGRNVDGTRQELADRLYSHYEELKAKGAEGADKGNEAFAEFKEAVFDSWSIDDLKEYLAGFGSKVEGTKDELVARASSSWQSFIHSVWPSPPPPPPKCYWSRFTEGSRQYLTRLLGLDLFSHGDL